MKAKRTIQTGSLGSVTLSVVARRFDAGLEAYCTIGRAELDALGEQFGSQTPMLFGARPCPAGELSAAQAWSGDDAISGGTVTRSLGVIPDAECATRMSAAVAEVEAYDAAVASLQSSASTVLSALEAELGAGASVAGWTVGGA